MEFPKIKDADRIERLQPPSGRIPIVIDTDTYNEIDDQFAIVYALFSPENFDIKGIYAAPFFNPRATSAGHGMQLSYEEILRLGERLHTPLDNLAFLGSQDFLKDIDHPHSSDAVTHLIDLAMNSTEPLYVVALGALTNIASAILIEPRIIEKITIVWMGGHAFHWPDNTEFNLRGDLLASQLIFNCGVPFVLIPARGVTSHLRTTVVELKHFVKGKGEIGNFLYDRFSAYEKLEDGGSKEIWDIVAPAWLINPDWVPSYITSSPMVAMQPPKKKPGPNPYPKEKYILSWSFDHTRHAIRYAYYVERDPVFKDFFTKLDRFAKGQLSPLSK
jgi:purine nucleosidase